MEKWLVLFFIICGFFQVTIHGSHLKIKYHGSGLRPAQLSFSTSRPRPRNEKQLAAVTRTLFLPVTPRSSRRKSAAVENYQNIQIFLDFVADYSQHKKWEVIQLLFPKADSKLCLHIQVFLLKKADLYVTCQSMDKENGTNSINNQSTNNNKKNIPDTGLSALESAITSVNGTLQDFLNLDEPIIACPFLSQFIQSQNQSEKNGQRSVNVSPKILINYMDKTEVMVIIGSAEDGRSEMIIDQLAPEFNANYKWTLTSLVNESSLQMEDIYGVATTNAPLRNSIGFWSSSTGLSIDRRQFLGPTDFQGKIIRVTTVEGNPVVYLEKKFEPGNGVVLKARGYLPDILLETVSKQLNFTYLLLTPADKSFGSADDQGNWSGMVGQLQRKEAEVAMMSFSLTEKRRSVMDFSPAIEYSSTRLLIRKDWQSTELKYKVFLQPFEYQVWLAIPITIFIGVVTFVIISYFKLAKTTPSSSAWFLSMCFLQQGQEEHTQISTFPSRIALVSFWVLAVVLYASYTARLTSYLAANTELMPFKSISEAVENPSWKIGLVKGSSIPDRVKESKVPEFMKMWKRLQTDSSSFVGGFQDGIERVYSERFIFFTSELIPTFIIKGNCSYSWIPGRFWSGFGYMGYQKHLPYASSISNQVAKIRESGILKRLYKKWWGSESSCSSSSNTGGFVAMSLYETCGAFLVLITGVLLSLTVVLVEFCVYLKQPPPTTDNNEQITNPDTLSQTNSSLSLSHRFSSKDDVHNNGKAVESLLDIRNTHNARIDKPQTPISMWLTKISQAFATKTHHTPPSGNRQDMSLHF